MQSINRDRWRVLEPLLDQVLELPPDQRAAWLDDLHTSDPTLAADLAVLLDRDSIAAQRSFLEPPATTSLTGLVIGAYTLERPLGHGGMGSVWLARRTDGRFEGRAAVKLLSLALLTVAGQERFRREGSVLARLAHPGIARLLDAGVGPTGQPYLVLEYVDGIPIDDFVRQREMSATACVRFFLGVLDAVGHAHASLIVHRDLKPSNILVAPDASVKLLDFGIAKLLDTEDPHASVTGDARILTPEYAAPEQVHGEAVTTATDVYALGVLLYLLLSGRHPTVEGCQTPAAVLKAILEKEPARLGHGDLDLVLAKALRVVPAERYQTIAAFEADLRHWLENEPVSARADSVAYRARKFVRRHRGSVALAAAGVVLAAGYGATIIAERERVSRALDEATANARRAEQVTDFAAGLFEAVGHGNAYADSLTARELLVRAVARAHELSGQPTIEAQMLDLIGRIRMKLGDFDEAEPVLEEALAIRRRVLSPDHPDIATSLMNTADLFTATESNHQLAIQRRREALALRSRLFGDYDPRTTDALYQLAGDLHRGGDYKSSRLLFDQWIARTSRQAPQVTPERAEQLGMLADVLNYSGQFARAETLFRQALAMDRALYGDDHPRVGILLAQVGSVLTYESRYAAADTTLHVAVAQLRRAYPLGHPALAAALRDLGVNLVSARRLDEADSVWRECTEMYLKYIGDSTVEYVNALSWLGRVQADRGQYGPAERTLRKALSLKPSRRPPPNPLAARTRLFLGEALRGQGRLAEAEPLLLEAYRRRTGAGFGRPQHDYAMRSLAALYTAEGRPDEAAKYR